MENYSRSYPDTLSVELASSDRIRRSRSAYLAAKLSFDFLVALALAPIAALLIGVLAVLVRLDGGPAFYRQPRLGKDGRTFMLWKLRTMVPDADLRLREYLNENMAARIEWDRTQKLPGRPPHHRHRQISAQILAGRAAATLERSSRPYEPCRPKTDVSRTKVGLSRYRILRNAAGHNGSLAG